MEISWYVLAVIIGSGIVTVIPRVLPLVVLSRMQIPEWGLRWLSHVPIAVMAALVAQELLINNGEIVSLANNLKFWAAVPTFLVAIITRSLLSTVLVGILSLMLLRFFV